MLFYTTTIAADDDTDTAVLLLLLLLLVVVAVVLFLSDNKTTNRIPIRQWLHPSKVLMHDFNNSDKCTVFDFMTLKFDLLSFKLLVGSDKQFALKSRELTALH